MDRSVNRAPTEGTVDPAHSEEGVAAIGHEETLHLQRQLCFAVHAASRAFDALYRPLLSELGLTYPQYLAMLALWEHRSLTVTELGSALRLDSGTLSPLLKRMESTGLVVRERSRSDERSVRVSLTPSGAALKERARTVPATILTATGMAPDEIATLRAALTQLTAALDAADTPGA
ncbi:MarR family winged helix-turn-helix transcriptional regulator [Salinactinospora qingdaonensis]|uniref:HTH marR-type domain-containing protein n=1 Tax=Salinactinospora qingdaonensis TaxID=702744 RepID=A0ABP7GCR6_9ACTN